jgi:hypothetical protein
MKYSKEEIFLMGNSEFNDAFKGKNVEVEQFDGKKLNGFVEKILLATNLNENPRENLVVALEIKGCVVNIKNIKTISVE